MEESSKLLMHIKKAIADYEKSNKETSKKKASDDEEEEDEDDLLDDAEL